MHLFRSAIQTAALLAAIGVAVALPGLAANDEAARGQSLVEANCAQCHAIGKQDAGKHPDAPNFRDLHKRWPVEQLEEALAEGMVTGHPEMPVIAFSADDGAAIIAYLKSLAE